MALVLSIFHAFRARANKTPFQSESFEPSFILKESRGADNFLSKLPGQYSGFFKKYNWKMKVLLCPATFA